MPCAAGGYPWAVVAKQSNDFSGLPGNALGPVSGTLSTTVRGSCKLRFVGQPGGTRTGELIRAADFDQESPLLVSVEAIDGSPLPPIDGSPLPQRLTWFTGPISISPSSGSFSASAPPAVMRGLFSYSGLKLGAPGSYTLRATGTGFSAGTSSGFQVADVAEKCNATKCDAHLDGSLTSSTLNGVLGAGAEGHVLLSLNAGPQPECSGYVSPMGDWYEFMVTTERDKTIAVTYSKEAMRKVKGASSLEICFASPEPFTAKTGPATPFDYDGQLSTGANGLEGYVGLLPDCPDTPDSPCILSRGSGGGGTALVEFFVPGRLGDPRYH